MKYLITGGSGLVGRAIKEILKEGIYLSSESHLEDFDEAGKKFLINQPEYVIHLAAKVGGIRYNQEHLGEMYYINSCINNSVLELSRRYNVKKVISLSSTCVYPASCSLPLKEGDIHLGIPHSSNFAYAFSKRMLDVMSRAYRKQYGCNFITAVPSNIFGIGDNFDLDSSHFIPAIIRKVYEAKQKNEKEIIVWGSGKPLREFTYSKDVAKILLFLLENYNDEYPVNIGNTKEYSVEEVVYKIMKIMKFDGKIVYDTTKPDGQFRKPSDNSKLLAYGWKKEDYTDFDEALNETIEWFNRSYPNVRGVK